MDFYNKTVEETIKELKTSKEGLSEKEAEERLIKYGKNELKKKEAISALKIILNQFSSYIIAVYFVAVIICVFLNRFIDAWIILGVLIINTILGFIQEYKAEKAIRELSKLTTQNVVVVRENKKKVIKSEELVPGDIIEINAGNYIPADCRLIEIFNLKVDESTLTGESVSVEKYIGITKKELITDQKNMAFSSTICVHGKAKAIVVKTGMNTEIGKIAKEIQQIKETKTPLIKKLDVLGKNIAIGIAVICLVIFIIGLLWKELDILNMFLVSVTLAIAAIPEGLPAMITITLAIGLQALSKKNVLVRKLPAVETLGNTTIIFTDKTGTLTKNEMTVKEIFVNNKSIKVTGEGYNIDGEFLYNKINLDELKQIMQIADLCNDSDLNSLYGDPTELALKVVVKKSKLNITKYTRVGEIPFSSEEKYMATLHKIGEKDAYYFKGAPEKILDMCSHIDINGTIRILSNKEKKEIQLINEKMGSNALRVLAFAYSKGVNTKNLIFVGLMGMIDPPRPEVKRSIELCKQAGIRTIMITGDHKETAKAIGKQVGISGGIITGEEIEKLSKEELKDISNKINIYARVTAKHKLMVMDLFDLSKEVIAMTGDGINDAPALKKADIGVSFESGTDVAKEASEIVLKDNNFANIVEAVKIGRGIYRNLKKIIFYLLSGNLGELLTVLIAVLFGYPLILLPIHILWVNLVTDSLPALALGAEPVEEDVMNSKPRKRNSPIINRQNLIDISMIGILIATACIFIFKVYNNYFGFEYARTMAFTTLVTLQTFNVINSKSGKSLFKMDFFSNKYLLYSILISILLQVMVIYLFNGVFEVVKLSILDWFYVFLTSITIIIFMEIRKFMINNHKGESY